MSHAEVFPLCVTIHVTRAAVKRSNDMYLQMLSQKSGHKVFSLKMESNFENKEEENIFLAECRIPDDLELCVSALVVSTSTILMTS